MVSRSDGIQQGIDALYGLEQEAFKALEVLSEDAPDSDEFLIMYGHHEALVEALRALEGMQQRSLSWERKNWTP